MKCPTVVTLLALAMAIGCDSKPVPKSTSQPSAPSAAPSTRTETSTAADSTASDSTMAEEKTGAATPTEATPAAAATARKPVAVVDGTAELNPENSRVRFVGAHVGEKPDPRTGGFSKFSGKLSVDAGALKGLTFEIATESLWTEIGGKLTTHLKSPDFLDTNEYPEIKFQSTQIAAQDDGKVAITGELKLHGVTKSITVPATVSLGEDGVTLVAEFSIDRADFDMTTAVDKVEKSVSLTVIVGEANEPKAGPSGD